MRSGSYLIITGLVLVAVGVAWMIIGSPGAYTGFTIPAIPAPAVTAGTPISSPPVVTPGPGSPSLSMPSPQVTQQISSDDIKLHFMDLAFGSGNTYLEQWTGTETNGRIIISVSGGSDQDAALLSGAAKDFNSISAVTRLSAVVKDGMNGDIAIKFVTPDGLDDIVLGTSDFLPNREFQSNGTTVAKATQGIIYIDSDLTGDQRNHTLMRTLYYELGATGDTQRYQDSLFYNGDNTNVNLTSIDRSAIGILYGPGFSPGMTVDTVKTALNIS